MPSFVTPDLDLALQAKGFTEEGATLTLYGHRDAVVAEADPDVELLTNPAPAWLDAMAALQNYSKTQRATYGAIVSRVTSPAAFVALRVDGELAALAFGVLDGDIHVCESVITHPQHRRRGYAQRTLAALHRWALDGGARHFCLQVEATNTPAVNLYQGLGLRGDLYRYHYRREPKA